MRTFFSVTKVCTDEAVLLVVRSSRRPMVISLVLLFSAVVSHLHLSEFLSVLLFCFYVCRVCRNRRKPKKSKFLPKGQHVAPDHVVAVALGERVHNNANQFALAKLPYPLEHDHVIFFHYDGVIKLQE